MSKKTMSMSTSICLFMDVYGFSSLVREDLVEASRVLHVFHGIVDGKVTFASKQPTRPNIKVQVLSDCVFLTIDIENGCENQTEKIEIFFNCISEIYLTSMSEGISLRGYVSHGQIVNESQVLCGLPIVESVCNEPKIRAPCIIATKGFLDTLPLKNEFDRAVISRRLGRFYRVPFEDGFVQAKIVASNINILKETALSRKNICGANAKTSKAALAWENLLAIVDVEVV